MMSTMPPAPDRTHAPPRPQEPSALGTLLDRQWSDADLEPRAYFPRAVSRQVRRAALAVAVTVACERCDAYRAELPYRRVTE